MLSIILNVWLVFSTIIPTMAVLFMSADVGMKSRYGVLTTLVVIFGYLMFVKYVNAELFLPIVALFNIWFAISRLRRANADIVQTIWYFFSLAAFATLLCGTWAVATNTIDVRGNASNKTGSFIVQLFAELLDFDQDFAILLGFASLIIVPQIIAYFLSGMFGCASRPLFVTFTARLLIWGVIKSFAVTSGLAAGWELICISQHWAFLGNSSLIIVSNMMSSAFWIALAYTQRSLIIDYVRNACPTRLAAFAQAIHRITTRHRS